MEYGEICTVSGIFKIVELLTTFCAIMIHRFGDNGYYLFFATTAIKMSPGDEGMNVENLGNGTLVSCMIISGSLLVTYILDGRYPVQILFLETIWNGLLFCLLGATGIKTILNWSLYHQLKDDTRNKHSGLALGSLCIIGSIIYFCDFIFAWSARNRLRREAY